MVDVADGRLRLDPLDRHAYCKYARSMPAPPAMKKPTNRRAVFPDWPGTKETVDAPDFIFKQPSAAWESAGSSSSHAHGASSAAAAELRPLDPKTARGQRVFIPHSVWPDYACAENGGAGWSAVIKSCSAAGVAKVGFQTATDDEGRACPDEHLHLADLRPI